jgi:hypothetical protein
MSGGLQNPLPEGADDVIRHHRSRPERRGPWARLGDALGAFAAVVLAAIAIQLLVTDAPNNTPDLAAKAESIVADLPSDGGGLTGAAAEVQVILENDRESDRLAAAWNSYTQAQAVYDGDLESLAGVVDQLPIATGKRSREDVFWLRDSIRSLKEASRGLYDCLGVEQSRLWRERSKAAIDATAIAAAPRRVIDAAAPTEGDQAVGATSPAGPLPTEAAAPVRRVPAQVKVVCKRTDRSNYFYEAQLTARRACSEALVESLPGLLRFLREEGRVSPLDKLRLGFGGFWSRANETLRGVRHSAPETEAQYWVRLRGDLNMVCGNVLEPPSIRVAPTPRPQKGEPAKPVLPPPSQGEASVASPATTAGPPVPKGPVITGVQALARPTRAQVAATYPSQGRRAKVIANVTLRCLADVDGALKRCTATATPPGYGFEDAAKKLAKYYVIQPRTVDGKPEASYVDDLVVYRLEDIE